MLICAGIALQAQTKNQVVSGRVLEAGNNNPVVGASVTAQAEGSTSKTGTHTDVEGRFFLSLAPNKKYSITITNIGFAAKKVDDITTIPGADPAPLSINLEKSNAELSAVVVTASAKREAISSLYSAQKNAASISDGISAEVIRKSPDRNTGEVLKRVSGASVQDNKFVIIRGLSERYNVSMLNNSVLPSTEADKKAFSFDIIPASVVDNLVISKSASPDLPGDFSGGAIRITTKDYPNKKISELSIGISFNSLTTGKNFYNGFPNGSYDKIGFFDDSRLIPGPYYRNKSGFINQSPEYKREVTKMFPNNYGSEAVSKSMPNIGISYTGGNTKIFKSGNKLGYIYNVGYGIGRAVGDRERSEYDITQRNLYNYNTTNYDQKNNLTGLLNLTYSYRKSKISFKNLFNNTFVKTLGLRNGENLENGEESVFQVKSSNSEATQNGIFNIVLEGLHKVSDNFTLDWNGSFAYTYRNQPDQRILAYRTPDNSKTDYYLKLSNENSPEIRNAGRVYSFLGEYIYGASANGTYTFNMFGENQKFKFGTMNYYRDRTVEVDALGYASLNFTGVTIAETKETTFDNIFSSENIDKYNLTVANIGTNSTDYTANALLNAGYLMLDNKFSEKLRLTWGARIEKYRQELVTKGRQNMVYDNTDVLPSLLLTYSLNNKTNLRLGGSMAVNRPEFRELADYSVFDYDNNLVIRGNPNLERCRNTNADLRYEWFPAAGEIISASVFYKYFRDPIEQTNKGNDVLTYENADHATAYGVEVEVRKKLDFIGGNFFSDLAFYANAAYIKGSVQFGEVSYNNPMQGQSPYLINGGLNYSHNGFSVNALYNRIGPRLRFRATAGAALNIFERPRDVVDLQISKMFLRNRLEIKLTVSDLLAQPFTWYYKYDPNPSNLNYIAGEDRIINSIKYGSTTTLALKYIFGR
ncbi:putative TonB-dependent receptor [Flavihumibacter petaseus NBRC 106054]|uniref:Putative TonB-dependent receptor n=1 Tax=Flavihumibacter petaseus NBRC 106054 TaxID=1220578 RepID=A0A0E9MWB4_9BACT|nr:putative TonB-dependent receptor [Flavihumibacter petaseus NBRC 106054]